MSVIVQVRQRASAHVSVAMILWAIAMTVALVVWELNPAHELDAYWWGLIATLIFGAYLGWRRRGAAVFVAPLASWLFAWLPLWIAAMFRHGFLKGLVIGLFLVTVGWVVIGALEFLSLGAVTLLVRSLRGAGPTVGEREVVVYGPDELI